METSSRTKSVERPVRAVDLFIASLDALTSLQGSSTLSAWIDSDERCWLFRMAGLPWRKKKKKGQRDVRRAGTGGKKSSRDYILVCQKAERRVPDRTLRSAAECCGVHTPRERERQTRTGRM